MSKSVGQHRDAFLHLEERYRAFLAASLLVVISSTPATPEKLPTRALLQKLLRAATKQNNSRFDFDFEQSLPMNIGYKPDSFYEALPRLVDDHGHKLMPVDIFPAVNSINMEVGSTMGALLRLWIMSAQIRKFYEVRDAEDKMSININPADLDHSYYREGLANVIAGAQACGYGNIVLEALECGPWTPERLAFISSLQEYGAILAIDDYGDPDGYHDKKTLIDFSSASTGRSLIVKLDGHIIRNFMDKNDEALIARLAEIRAHAPQAKVVAEWVKSAEEAQDLRQRIAEKGFEGAIHMVQSRDLHETWDIFLRNMGKCTTATPPAPPVIG